MIEICTPRRAAEAVRAFRAADLICACAEGRGWTERRESLTRQISVGEEASGLEGSISFRSEEIQHRAGGRIVEGGGGAPVSEGGVGILRIALGGDSTSVLPLGPSCGGRGVIAGACTSTCGRPDGGVDDVAVLAYWRFVGISSRESRPVIQGTILTGFVGAHTSCLGSPDVRSIIRCSGPVRF
jgi:hypothetical protein